MDNMRFNLQVNSLDATRASVEVVDWGDRVTWPEPYEVRPASLLGTLECPLLLFTHPLSCY